MHEIIRKITGASSRKLNSIEEAWRALGMLSMRIPRIYVLSPSSREAKRLAEELAEYEAELDTADSARTIERVFVRLQDTTEEFAKHQQRQVDHLLHEMSEAVRAVVEGVSRRSEDQELILDDLQNLETDLSRAAQARNLDEARSHLAKGISTVNKVVEKQLHYQDQMRLEAERAAALMNKRLKEAEAEGRTDSLTRVGNRVAFEYYGEAIQSKVNAGEFPFTIAMIDLDGFKGINDTHGHAAGDEALRTFVDRLRQTVGDKSFIGRLGGDEFAVIMTATEQVAVVRLSRLLRGMERCPIWLNVAGQQIETHFSFSFGCVELKPGRSLKESSQKADEIMYEHKRQRKPDRRAA